MNTFFKTFFVCLFIAFGFLSYKYFSMKEHSDDLFVSKTSTVFGIHEDVEDKTAFTKEQKEHLNDNINQEQIDSKKETKSDKKDEKYTHTCYFYSNNGQLIPLKRQLSAKPTIESQISLRLKGPWISETKKGYYSEIPANVDLISVKRIDNNVIVNLSSNFGNGGGSQSIENRVKQLSKTVKSIAPGKNVYLYINDKEVEYLGGDGVYIKQPLEWLYCNPIFVFYFLIESFIIYVYWIVF